MRILAFVSEIGSSASGIISERIIDELILQKHEILVITSKSSKTYDADQVFCCKPLLRPDMLSYKIVDKILRFIGVDRFNYNPIWRIRAFFKAIGISIKWKPDFIYCRTSPIDPCFVGIRLKRLFNIPLVVNLTDPLPAPVEYLSEGKIRRQRLRNAQTIISAADLISMGTEQALHYQIKETVVDFSHKAFISPDPVPYNTLRCFDRGERSEINIVYLGAIYGSRNIIPLIEAIKQIRLGGKSVVLKIYGMFPSYIKEDFVVKCSFVKNVDTALAEADILADIDGDDSEPVFVSSKLKQYLTVNRPILSITPHDSPSYHLLKDLESVTVVNNKAESIFEALSDIIENGEYDYNDRIDLIQSFSPSSIVGELISQVSTKLMGIDNE